MQILTISHLKIEIKSMALSDLRKDTLHILQGLSLLVLCFSYRQLFYLLYILLLQRVRSVTKEVVVDLAIKDLNQAEVIEEEEEIIEEEEIWKTKQ